MRSVLLNFKVYSIVSPKLLLLTFQLPSLSKNVLL